MKSTCSCSTSGTSPRWPDCSNTTCLTPRRSLPSRWRGTEALNDSAICLQISYLLCSNLVAAGPKRAFDVELLKPSIEVDHVARCATRFSSGHDPEHLWRRSALGP